MLLDNSHNVYINSLLAMFNARDQKKRQGSSVSGSLPPVKDDDEERIIDVVPLSTIGQATQTLDKSIDEQFKLELQSYGSR
ncbi:uncharacterized protein ARMOST_14188 [Armillaria ostoyae]|uniref:Uncharacterized protein n=1 Tax=Armillaria ostoyae TaxID=47428 RepID=A0A284RPW5_ARMOS|nr:uncharacterized protein ARMOST_14188 [Armillaria ostoyae]